MREISPSRITHRGSGQYHAQKHLTNLRKSRPLPSLGALLILTLIPLGIAMTRMADSPVKSALYLIHVNIGWVVLLLTALRVLWRFIEPSPSLPKGLSPARQWLYKAVHTGQYILLIGLTITGTGTFMATGPLSNALPETVALTLPAAHSLLSKVFMGLLLAHLTGIFQYQWTQGDVLSRMGFPKALLNVLPSLGKKAVIQE